MNPRRPSSTKWTLIPTELTAEITSVFQQAYPQIKDTKWYIEGYIYPEEFILRVGYGRNKSLKQSHFFLSWDRSDNQNLVDEIHLAVDLVDQIIGDYLKNEERPDLPTSWKALSDKSFEKPLYFIFSTENKDLEDQANSLLGQSQDTLTGGDWEIQNETESHENENDSTDELPELNKRH